MPNPRKCARGILTKPTPRFPPRSGLVQRLLGCGRPTLLLAGFATYLRRPPNGRPGPNALRLKHLRPPGLDPAAGDGLRRQQPISPGIGCGRLLTARAPEAAVRRPGGGPRRTPDPDECTHGSAGRNKKMGRPGWCGGRSAPGARSRSRHQQVRPGPAAQAAARLRHRVASGPAGAPASRSARRAWTAPRQTPRSGTPRRPAAPATTAACPVG
jgi:hypothetical protein